jgi:hypothetical protein
MIHSRRNSFKNRYGFSCRLKDSEVQEILDTVRGDENTAQIFAQLKAMYEKDFELFGSYQDRPR